MEVIKIDGGQLEGMFRNGLAILKQHEEEINRLNVFPVADGDTGTNMYLTLKNGLDYAPSKEPVGAYMENLCRGMLLGARGNSGSILSQFFSGMFNALHHCGWANVIDIQEALESGCKAAYGAVVKPVEGTILTVCRQGYEATKNTVRRGDPIQNLLAVYVRAMRQSLMETPKLLPVLKEAGVIDSGAIAFIFIFEGMLAYLQGNITKIDEIPETDAKDEIPSDIIFNENSKFEEGYCLEFVLQLLCSDGYNQDFSLASYKKNLLSMGSSIVVNSARSLVKVHIHTKKPAMVISYSQNYGEFVSFKLDNMQIQHNEYLLQNAKTRHKSVASIAVCDSTGTEFLFKGLGCDLCLAADRDMNVKVDDFVDAFLTVDADIVAVFPNSPANAEAAAKAVALSKHSNIRIMASESMVSCYFALSMDVADSDDADYRISQMEMGLDGLVSLTESKASRSYTYHSIHCRRGDDVVLMNGIPVCVSDADDKAIMGSLKLIEDMDDKESCVIFKGKDKTAGDFLKLKSAIAAEYPLLEISMIESEQTAYSWMVGIL